MPPPLVSMARRLPESAARARASPRRRTTRPDRARVAGRAAERGVIDGIGPGECAGMGLRRLGALRMTAGLDHDDRLCPRGGPRRRHELARVLDRLDVEENGACAAVEGEIVEQVAEIDVDPVAERDDRREADRARAAHSTRPAAMAPDCEISARSPAPWHAGGEAALSFAPGTRTPRQLGPTSRRPSASRLFAGFGERARPVTEPCRDDDRGGEAALACRGDDGGHRRGGVAMTTSRAPRAVP